VYSYLTKCKFLHFSQAILIKLVVIETELSECKHFYTDLKDSRNLYGDDLLLNGNAPNAGEIMTMPHLAATLKVSYK